MADTIVLDLDGPILDGRQRHYACYRSILEANGHSPMPIDAYWEMKRERADRRAQLAASNSGELYDVFLSAWLEAIEQPEFLELDVLQPGVIAKLRTWKRQGRRLLLATQRHNRDGLARQVERLRVAPYLDHVLPCEHATGGAGKAAQVRLAIPDLAAEETLWIGDTEVDIDAARALGCQIWAVTCGLRTESYLRSLRPDRLFGRLEQIDLGTP